VLQAYLSIGYIVLLAILVLAFILWRRGAPILAIAALVVGIPLWFGWEYVRPTWTTGVITGTEVRRSDPDARGNTTDIEYIYMRNRFDRGLELINDDSWWWLKRNSERVFNDAKTAQDRNTEVTLMWNRWRSTLFSWYPNAIAIGSAGSWPWWSVRTIIFYGLSVVLWLSYFYAFFRLRRSSAPLRDRNPSCPYRPCLASPSPWRRARRAGSRWRDRARETIWSSANTSPNAPILHPLATGFRPRGMIVHLAPCRKAALEVPRAPKPSLLCKLDRQA
jgi:uncharacterized protein DUF1523